MGDYRRGTARSRLGGPAGLRGPSGTCARVCTCRRAHAGSSGPFPRGTGAGAALGFSLADGPPPPGLRHNISLQRWAQSLPVQPLLCAPQQSPPHSIHSEVPGGPGQGSQPHLTSSWVASVLPHPLATSPLCGGHGGSRVSAAPRTPGSVMEASASTYFLPDGKQPPRAAGAPGRAAASAGEGRAARLHLLATITSAARRAEQK